LTEQSRGLRLQKCLELLGVLDGMEAGKFRNIVTGDESWFTLECQHSAKWTVSRDDVPEKVRQAIGTSKVMLTVIWGVNWFHGQDLITL
jgi:hypothetical protein